MPRIKLADGTQRNFEQGVTARGVLADTDGTSSDDALACRIDGRLSDLNTQITADCSLDFVRAGKPEHRDPEALWLLRHSAAHVMAEAIQRLIPGVKLAYGPPVEDGFYYDMKVPDSRQLSSDDFEAVEAEMKRIVDADLPFVRREFSAEQGLAKVKAEDNRYKLENAQKALAGSANPILSFYTTGAEEEAWQDLCEGPHLPSTRWIAAFRVLSLASAYFRGDASEDSLTRVYGTAFFSKEELDAYLERREEARKRDHRVVGKQLGLFHIDEQVGQGLVLWKPNGATVRQELQDFVSGLLREQGYHQVFTPHIGKLGLYRTSGHFPYYQDSQYPPIIAREAIDELATENASCGELANRLQKGQVDGFLLKPMNCPHHIRIYSSELRSYRDLPLRLAEFGTVYRWEQSGEIGGMTRVRGFTQDDAHIFCAPDSVPGELQLCLSLVGTVLNTLGLANYRVRVGLRDPDSAKCVGDKELWDQAEAALRKAADTLGVPWTAEVGEAAFYGPKIDFVVQDVIGREWQLGTVQLDYNLPQRFELTYVAADGTRQQPVMLHRAPLGSLERFVGILIEHFAGAFPTWLAPEQVSVLPVSEKSLAYGRSVLDALRQAGIRATLDDADMRLNARIREAAQRKVPYQLIVGPRDEAATNVSVRMRGPGNKQVVMPLAAFVQAVRKEVDSRALVSVLSE